MTLKTPMGARTRTVTETKMDLSIDKTNVQTHLKIETVTEMLTDALNPTMTWMGSMMDDQCPMKPEDIDGYKDEDGCPDPDNDRDGIPDVRDRCPDQPENVDGIEDEDGCPEERVLVTREKIEFDGKVYFETDRDEVKPASFDLLNEIAEVMNKHPELIKIEVQGHLDSRGGERIQSRPLRSPSCSSPKLFDLSWRRWRSTYESRLW